LQPGQIQASRLPFRGNGAIQAGFRHADPIDVPRYPEACAT